MHAYIHIYISTYIHTYLHTYIHAYIYTYVNTYTSIDSLLITKLSGNNELSLEIIKGVNCWRIFRDETNCI